MPVNDSPQPLPLDLVSVREAARVAGVMPSMVHSWIKRGRLAAQPSPSGRLVSQGAVQALGAPPDPHAPADAVSIYEAVRLTDVTKSTLVAWVTQGRLPSWHSRYGTVVRVADVQALAQQRAMAAAAGRNDTPMPPDALLIRDVVRLCGVTKGRIYTWVNQGRIPAWPGTGGAQRVRPADVVAQAAQYDRVLPRRKPTRRAMTSEQQLPPYDPPRLPLRVRVEVRGQLGDGASIVATAWRTLEPDEPEYEQAYQEAARAHRIYGWDMPYAEGGE